MTSVATQSAAGDSCQFDIAEVGDSYSGHVHAEPLFYGLLIGKNGVTRRNMERKTGTKISIPRNKANADVIVTGQSRDSVACALAQIKVLADSASHRAPFTHFFSVVANNEHIQARFVEFRRRVLSTLSGDEQASHEQLFQKPHKLHLSLFVLRLADQDAVDLIEIAINDFRRENALLFEQPLLLHIRGLDIWGRDATAARVVYGKVVESADQDRLRRLGMQLQQFLLARGLISRVERDSIQLHMTVMNVSFLGSSGTTRWRKKTFDCSAIVSEFADWDFGAAPVTEVQLCALHSATEDSYYTQLVSVAMGAVEDGS